MDKLKLPKALKSDLAGLVMLKRYPDALTFLNLPVKEQTRGNVELLCCAKEVGDDSTGPSCTRLKGHTGICVHACQRDIIWTGRIDMTSEQTS